MEEWVRNRIEYGKPNGVRRGPGAQENRGGRGEGPEKGGGTPPSPCPAIGFL